MLRFYPDEYRENVYAMDFRTYYEAGYRAVMFDIDNTLVCDNAPADERAKSFLKDLIRMGYRVMALSNNYEPRVKSFAEDAGIDYLCRAHKPSPDGYLAGMEKLGSTKEDTLFVGDQIFTDIWGARRAGVHCVLTKPLDKKEIFVIRLKRIPEKPLLFFDRRRRKRMLAE